MYISIDCTMKNKVIKYVEYQKVQLISMKNFVAEKFKFIILKIARIWTNFVN